MPWRLCMASLTKIFRNCLRDAVWQPAWGPVFCVSPRGANGQRTTLYKSYLLLLFQRKTLYKSYLSLLLLELPWEGEGKERTYDSSRRLSADKSYFLRPRYRMPGERMGRVVVGRKMIIMTYRSISINYAIGYTEHGVLPLHHFFLTKAQWPLCLGSSRERRLGFSEGAASIMLAAITHGR